MRKQNVKVDAIHVGDRFRANIDEDTVVGLVASIQKIGLQNPISVCFKNDVTVDGEVLDSVPVLVSGRHRLEAIRRIGGRTHIECVVFDDPIMARLWEISENLHRADLDALDRDEHVAEWIRLTEGRQKEERNTFANGESIRGRGQPEGGINAAARELRVKKDDAYRAVKVDALPEPAKAVARETGLSKKRGALLEAAKEADDDAKVAKMREIAEREERKRQERAEARKTPPPERTIDAASTDLALPGASFGVTQVGVHIVDDYVKRTRSAVQLLAELDAIGDYSIRALADAIRAALRLRSEPI